MSLASTLNTTKSIFSNTAAQSAVVSTNIQNASNSDYNKRSVSTSVNLYSGATILSTERAQNSALLKQILNSTADDSGQQTLLSGLESVSALLGGTDYSLAPSAYLSNLQTTLQTYAATPGDITLAQSVINAAQDVANSLNNVSTGIQEIRSEADAEIANQVDKLNSLLADFQTANDMVIKKTALGQDASDAVDKREALVKQISSIIGVSTYMRDGNDMALYTSDGTTLFETVPRTVSFSATSAYVAGTTGNAIYIDGVKVEAGTGSSTSAQGSLPALLQLRDDVLPTIQSQLDEVARGLISMFAETDGTDQIAGLFTTNDGSVVDFTNPEIISGLASMITVASGAITSPLSLRDGTINPDSVSANTTSASGFSTLLQSYITNFSTPVQFDGDAKLGTSLTLFAFATDSVGWIEANRSDATTAGETTTAMLSRSTEAYSNNTGVNLDEELILLLDIEQSYKAASKLLATIDEMLQALMAAAD